MQCHIARKTSRSLLAGLLSVVLINSANAEQRIGKGLELDASLYAEMVSTHERTNGDWDSAQFAELTGSVDLSSRYSAWSGGIALNYSVNVSAPREKFVMFGPYVKYRWDRIDVLGMLVAGKATVGVEHGYFMGRLRYRISGQQKISLKAMGATADANHPKLVLAYDRTLTDTLDLGLEAGSYTGSDAGLSLRLGLAWQIR